MLSIVLAVARSTHHVRHLWHTTKSLTPNVLPRPSPPQADKIVSLTQVANCPVEPIWATLLAKALEGKDVKEMLSSVGSGAGGAAVAAAPAAAAGGAAPAAEEKKEEKKEEKEESDDGECRRQARLYAMLPLEESLLTRCRHPSPLALRHGLRSLRLNVDELAASRVLFVSSSTSCKSTRPPLLPHQLIIVGVRDATSLARKQYTEILDAKGVNGVV